MPNPTSATGLLRRLTHERDLLADALGRVLVASGAANDVPLTGPQLLLLADDLVEHLTGATMEPLAARLARFGLSGNIKVGAHPDVPGAPDALESARKPNAVPPAPYCPRCDTDDHRCPGCGAPVEHGAVACLDCNRNA